MVSNQRPTGRATSMPKGLLFGALGGVSVTIITTGVLAKLIDMETVSWEQVGYGVMVILLLSSASGAVISSHRIKHRILLVCTLSGAIYFVILMSVTALFFGGQYEAVGVTCALIASGSIGVGLLAVGRGDGRSNQKRRKIRF